MSLILDALRKADAERERGSVPSLHSQPVASTTAQTPPKQTAPRNWLWVAIGIAVGLAGAAAWVLVSRDPAPPTATAARSDPAPSSAAAVTQSAPTTQGAPPPAAAAGAAPSPAPWPAESQPAAEPAPWRPAEERKDARTDAKGSAAAQAIGPAAADPAIYPVDQLPPNIRAQIPQLTIGGSIYSPSPAGRSLIVNGQLYRERDRLTPDLSLEEIKLKAAVFSFRGHRFEVLF